MEKIEFFLYDILGLCIPGFVVILTMEFKFHLLNVIGKLLEDIPQALFAISFGAILLITCYIIGSVLKFISKIIYLVLQWIFDELINKLIQWILKIIPEDKIDMDWIDKNILHHKLYIFLRSNFVFKPQEYDNKYEEFYKKIKDKMGKGNDRNEKEELDKTIYKFAQIVTMNNSIKTHSNLFLAKYYLYKLLACWSFIYIIVVLAYKDNFSHYIWLTFGLFLSFFAFNYKYKLYKKLNGNELITGLYYFLYGDNLKF